MEGADESDSARPAAWETTVERGGAKALMEQVLEEAARSSSEALVLDGDMVFGEDHVASALAHARKASSEGRNASDSLAMETLLYASGERQLSSAIRKMSVSDRSEKVVVAVVRGTYSPGEGWRRLGPGERAPDPRRLKRFGISEKELSTVSEDKWAELVLERVAAVDVVKK